MESEKEILKQVQRVFPDAKLAYVEDSSIQVMVRHGRGHPCHTVDITHPADSANDFLKRRPDLKDSYDRKVRGDGNSAAMQLVALMLRG